MVFRLSGKNKPIVAELLCSVALLLAVSACTSGSGESAPNSQTGASAAGPAQEVKVEMGDFFYKPDDISLKAGKVRFTLTNVGATAHRFSIKTGDTVKWTSKNVGAGRESILEVELPPGTYALGCTLGDHEARGAAGTLTVQ